MNIMQVYKGQKTDVEVGCLSLAYGSQELNLDCKSQQQAPLPPEPAHQPLKRDFSCISFKPGLTVYP